MISSIGICDLSAENLQRLEMEMNQISYPFEEAGSLPQVTPVAEEQLFDCDVFVFCASKGVLGRHKTAGSKKCLAKWIYGV